MKKAIIITVLFLAQFLQAQNTITKAFSKSYELETNKKYREAIDAIASLNQDTYVVNLRLGWLHYLKGNFNKSKNYYNRAITKHNNSIEARFGLVYPLSAMQNWDEVITDYNSILKLDKNNAKANYQLAYIYFVRKEWNKTENYLHKILDLYPFDYDSNLLLGSTLIKNGKIKEAKKVLQIALIYNPDSKVVKKLLKGL